MRRSEGKVQCPACSYSTNRATDLKRHIERKNSKCKITIKQLSKIKVGLRKRNKIKIGAQKCNKLKSHLNQLECDRCGLKCKSNTQLKRHQLILCLALLKRYCRNCGLYVREDVLHSHRARCKKKIKIIESRKKIKMNYNNKTGYKCSQCNLKLCNRRLLYLHRNLFHGGLDVDNDPIIDPDPNFQEVIEANKQHIYSQHKIGSLKSTYNYTTKDMAEGYSEIVKQLEEIYKDQKNAYKIAIQAGFVLQSVAEPDKFRYFIPGDNENIMDSPFQINKRSQLRQLINKLKKN